MQLDWIKLLDPVLSFCVYEGGAIEMVLQFSVTWCLFDDFKYFCCVFLQYKKCTFIY